MSSRRTVRGLLSFACALLLGAGAGVSHSAEPGHATAPAAESEFLEQNNAAMTRMMTNMDIAASGDVDEDFVGMMIPHHQGAIDMAQAELRYGKNEQLRRIAQEIIVEQQQEIAAMHLALGTTLPPSAASPDQIAPAAKQDPMPGHTHMGTHSPTHEEIQ
ncbi:DUF305 domain-containing protein [Caballeronia sp. LZ019]|uniref:DUF305 domain-containing protein n=1 Tax=Caballeronia sp. LZ019 TaxID=3038555 RepID=UPI003857C9F6